MVPLVSVICLCYNHAKFVENALQSVLLQTYPNIEIIVIDDCSKDDSKSVIEKILAKNPSIQYISNKENLGNCKSFNIGLAQAKGEFIIDFATDDLMLSDRIQKQINAFTTLPQDYGVVYTNAVNIDEEGKELTVHFKEGALTPSGNIYEMLLEKYIISPPTMMIKKEVFDKLGGYDESLAYEDFDFWIRSSREYRYHYLNEVLTKRRKTVGGHSSKFYQKRNTFMSSTTFKVIKKAMWLNKSESEKRALVKRIKYELREAFYMHNLEYVKKYYDLLKEVKSEDVSSYMIRLFALVRIPVYPFYKWYLQIRG